MTAATAVSVTTVAERGSSPSKLISPRNSPGRRRTGRHVDAHSSVEDEEELVSGITNPGKYDAGRSFETPGNPGDALELPLAASFKNRDFLELGLSVDNR